MSLKTTWWTLSATRAKRSSTFLFRIASLLAPLMVGFGVNYYADLILPLPVAIVIGITATVLCYVLLFKTTKAERKEVNQHLTDTDYQGPSIKLEIPTLHDDHYMKLSYFPNTKEWIATGHLDPTDFITEIQNRDLMADSYHTHQLTPHVQHLYGSYEYSPSLKRHAYKVLTAPLENTNPITIVRIPPEDDTTIGLAETT